MSTMLRDNTPTRRTRGTDKPYLPKAHLEDLHAVEADEQMAAGNSGQQVRHRRQHGSTR